MANFTTDELELISKERKAPNQRPVYYDSAQRVITSITEDFEGFLILQSSENKQKALSWITSATGLDANKQDQNDILERYLGIRATDAAARVEEISAVVSKFDDFKSGFLTDGTDSSRFADIGEVNTFLQSVQRPLNDILPRRERAIHEQNMSSMQLARLNQSKVTTDTQKELESWQTVMSAYKGQKNKQPVQTGSSPLGGLKA